MRLQLSKNTEDQFLTHVSDQEIHSAERNGDISNNITITLKASQVVIPPTVPKPAKAKVSMTYTNYKYSMSMHIFF